MSTAQKIKDMRKKAGLTQKELAEKTGLSIATIQGYEQGKYLPKIDGYYKLQTAFNCYLNDIMDPGDTTISSEFIHKLVDTVNGLSVQESFSEQEKILLEYFEQLNDSGQNKAIEQVVLLSKIPEYKKNNN